MNDKIKLIRKLLLLFTVQLLIWIPFGLFYNDNYNSSHDFLIPFLSPLIYFFLAFFLLITPERNKLWDTDSSVFINSTIPFIIFWGIYILIAIIIYILHKRSIHNNGSKIMEMIGSDVIDYIENKHLKKIKFNTDTWETEYLCEETGEHWILDYPESEYHGGGNPRLRKII